MIWFLWFEKLFWGLFGSMVVVHHAQKHPGLVRQAVGEMWQEATREPSPWEFWLLGIFACMAGIAFLASVFENKR